MISLILLKFKDGRIPAAHFHLGVVVVAAAAAANHHHLVAELTAAVLGGVFSAAVLVPLAAPWGWKSLSSYALLLHTCLEVGIFYALEMKEFQFNDTNSTRNN